MQIWHPCPSGTFQKGATRMLVPENMGIDTKIISLSILEIKICWIDRNGTFFSKKMSKMTFSKKWKKIFYSILELNLDLKYFIPMCTRNKVILNWSKWHIFLKKTVENDFFQKMEKNSLFYSRVEPRFKILYS